MDMSLRGSVRNRTESAPDPGKNLDDFLNKFAQVITLVEPARRETEQLQREFLGIRSKVPPTSQVSDFTLQRTTNELLAFKEDNDRLAKHAEDLRQQRVEAVHEKLNAETRADQLQNKVEAHEKLQSDLRDNCNEMKAENTKQTAEITDLKKALNKATEEKNKAVELAGELEDKLKKLERSKPIAADTRSPAVQRESPPRDTRNKANDQVGAVINSLYGRLYDNEWSDAFEVSEQHFEGESERTNALLQILLDIYKFCDNHRQEEYAKLTQRLMQTDMENLELPNEVIRLMSSCRRNIEQRHVDTLFEPLRTKIGHSDSPIAMLALKVPEFVLGCLQVCWKMVITSPPLVFAEVPEKDSVFNGTMYNHYTRAGDKVEFSVWPAILLHSGGPVVAKGTVECYKSPVFNDAVASKKQSVRMEQPAKPKSAQGMQPGSQDHVMHSDPPRQKETAKTDSSDYKLGNSTTTPQKSQQAHLSYPEEKLPSKFKMDSYRSYKRWGYRAERMELILGKEQYNLCKQYADWEESQSYSDF